MSILETFRSASPERKQTYTLGFVISFTILLALFYFVWGAFINFGHLTLEGEAPFTVKGADLVEIECTVSPCDLKLKPGFKSLTIYKEGFDSLFTDATVTRWKTTNLKLNLEVIPTISSTEQIPEIATTKNYSLISDDIRGGQKLVQESENFSKEIAFFPRAIKEPKLFSSYDKYLLIFGADNENYKVNIAGNSRELISNLPTIEVVEGAFSPSGRYFLFRDQNSQYYQLLDTDPSAQQRLKSLTLLFENTKLDWIYDDSLIFITSQSATPSTSSSIIGDFINVINALSEESLLFGRYYPQDNAYSKIDFELPLSSFPDLLITALNGQTVYLQKGDEKFKINLRKF